METDFSKRQILIVDDEPDIREILKDELTFSGANVDEAKNGKDAWEMLSKRSYDAVISDIRMPGGDGMTLATQIKQNGKGHLFANKEPVVFLITGFADVAPSEAYHVGVDAFVHKPFNLQSLVSSLHRALLPPEQRWRDVNLSGNLKAVPVAGTFAELVAQKKILLGRGGFFLNGQFVDLRRDDNIEVSTQDGHKILGIVRWLQPADAQESLAAGIGVEVLGLSNEAYSQMINAFGSAATASYIPRK